jgi:hypothetical protein
MPGGTAEHQEIYQQQVYEPKLQTESMEHETGFLSCLY